MGRPILVVEPDPRARSLIELALGREGFETVAVKTVEEGLRALGPDRDLPAAVVAEAQMPGADGFAFCGRLRADRRTSSIPFILLSASGRRSQVELATGVGADDYVMKPAFIKDIASLVRLKSHFGSVHSSFRADAKALPLPELLRALLAGVRSGRVEVDQGGGELIFRQGRVVDAVLGERRGVSALLPILLFADSGYSVTFTGALREGSFSMGLEELYRNVFPKVAQWRRDAQDGMHLSSRLVVDFARLRESLPEIPASVGEVMRLLDGQRTVREVILDSPLDEITAFAAIARLKALGVAVLKPLAEQRATLARKLFGPSENKWQENLDPLLVQEHRPAVASSTAQRAFHVIAAVVGVLVVAGGAGWVVAQGHGGKPLLARTVRQGGGNAGGRIGEPWFDIERTVSGVRSLRLRPSVETTSEFWLMLALAHFESQEREKAASEARRALQLDPRNGGAAVLLGTLYLDARQRAMADSELKSYLALEPDGPYADQARQLLNAP